MIKGKKTTCRWADLRMCECLEDWKITTKWYETILREKLALLKIIYMCPLTLSDIKETGYNSISLFLAYCQENPLSLSNGLHRFFYVENDKSKFIDLRLTYEELKRAAKKEMLHEINQAGYDEFVNLKRKIILDNAYDSPLYKLEYVPEKNDCISQTAIYMIHKDLLFQFVKEETLQRA